MATAANLLAAHTKPTVAKATCSQERSESYISLLLNHWHSPLMHAFVCYHGRENAADFLQQCVVGLRVIKQASSAVQWKARCSPARVEECGHWSGATGLPEGVALRRRTHQMSLHRRPSLIEYAASHAPLILQQLPVLMRLCPAANHEPLHAYCSRILTTLLPSMP